MSEHQNLSTSSRSLHQALPQHWVESLFKRMAFTYGARFVDQWRGIDTDGIKVEWAEKLGVLTDAELLHGVNSLHERDWPPTLPEFLKLCRPPVDPVVAYHEAMEQGGRRDRGQPDEWSSPAVFWAWKRISAHDFAHLPYAALKPRWEKVLAIELAKHPMDQIPAPMVALPQPGKATTSVAQAHKQLGSIKQANRAHEATIAADPKRWARELLARRDRGELLEIAQIEVAEAALGVR